MPRKLIQVYPLKGMDQSLHSALGTASLVENMRWDRRGLWRKSHGYERLVEVEEEGGAAAVLGLFWYDTDYGGQVAGVGTAPVLDRQQNRLLRLNASTVRTIDEGRYWTESMIGTQYLNVGDDLYIVNGANTPIRWDTRKPIQAGFSERPAAPLVEDRGVTNIWNWSSAHVTGTLKVPGIFEQYFDRAYTTNDTHNGKYFEGFGGKYQHGVGEAYPIGDDRNVLGDPESTYGYAVTYLNELGMESPLSELRFSTGFTFSDRQTLRRFAFAKSAATCSSIRVYRTKPYGVGLSSDNNGNLIRFPLANYTLDLRPSQTKLFAQSRSGLVEEAPCVSRCTATRKPMQTDYGTTLKPPACGPGGRPCWRGTALWAAGTVSYRTGCTSVTRCIGSSGLNLT